MPTFMLVNIFVALYNSMPTVPGHVIFTKMLGLRLLVVVLYLDLGPVPDCVGQTIQDHNRQYFDTFEFWMEHKDGNPLLL